MMNCDDFRRLKHDYADAELDQAATEELLAHAAGCAECAEGLHVLERLRGLLRGSAVEEPTEAALRRALQAVAAAADVEAAWVRSDPPAIMTLGESLTRSPTSSWPDTCDSGGRRSNVGRRSRSSGRPPLPSAPS